MNQSPENAARSMFPLMPDEVFDGWLRPLISLQGWPFASVSDSTNAGKWAGQLLDMPLAEWAEFTWEKRVFDKGMLRLVPLTVELVMKVAMHFGGLGGANSRINIRGSRERVQSAVDFINEIGGIPGCLTAFDRGDGFLELVDGHHRLAACWSVERDVALSIWIASRAA